MSNSILDKTKEYRNNIKEQAIEQISCLDYLTPSGKKFFECPFCDSGKRENGTGAVKYYSETNSFYCFSCQKRGNVLDLLSSDYNEALKIAAVILGIDNNSEGLKIPKKHSPSLQADKRHADKEKSRGNFTDYFSQCHKTLLNEVAGAKGRAYLESRGLTSDLWEKFCIGYDSDFKHPSAIKNGTAPKHGGQYVIIPTSKYTGLARNINRLPDKEKNPQLYKKLENLQKMQLSTPYPLRLETLRIAKEPFFVVEGEIDALSLFEIGLQAVSMGGLKNNILINFLERITLKVPLILMLDNDSKDSQRGQAAQAQLMEALQQRQIIAYNAIDLCPQIYNGEKDANAALSKDREKFFWDARKASWLAQEAYILELIPGKEEFYNFAKLEREE